jgi:hypothetical protein
MVLTILFSVLKLVKLWMYTLNKQSLNGNNHPSESEAHQPLLIRRTLAGQTMTNRKRRMKVVHRWQTGGTLLGSGVANRARGPEVLE